MAPLDLRLGYAPGRRGSRRVTVLAELLRAALLRAGAKPG